MIEMLLWVGRSVRQFITTSTNASSSNKHLVPYNLFLYREACMVMQEPLIIVTTNNLEESVFLFLPRYASHAFHLFFLVLCILIMVLASSYTICTLLAFHAGKVFYDSVQEAMDNNPKE